MKNFILYIATSIIIVVLLPIASWMIPIFNLLMIYVAMIPVVVAAHIIGFPELYKTEFMGILPNGTVGYVFTLVLWVFFGALIGVVVYKIREASANKEGEQVPSPNASVFISVVSFQILIAIISFCIGGIMKISI